MKETIQLDLKNTGVLSDLFAKWLPEASTSIKDLLQKNCVGHEYTGWFDWPSESGFKVLEDIESWKQDYDVAYDTVVVCGIGGSFAGTRAVEQVLNSTYTELGNVSAGSDFKTILYAGHNLSELYHINLLETLEQCSPVINVISKSGTTTEPSVAFRILRSYMEKRFGIKEARRRIIVTTDEQSGVLKKLSDEENYKRFVIPENVGGRYSVLTAVGLVPLTLASYPVQELLEGADDLFSSLKKDHVEHTVLQYACLRRAAWELGKTIDIFSYGEPKFFSFVEWWKQLFGESEGKENKGLFPASMIYSTDLHSLGQFVQEGNPTVLETFLFMNNLKTNTQQVEKRLRVPSIKGITDKLDYLEGKYLDEINQAAMKAALMAHSDRGVPCISLTLKDCTANSLGHMFAFFESSCAISASLLKVNPFNQDGVEAYKKNLFRLMGRPD